MKLQSHGRLRSLLVPLQLTCLVFSVQAFTPVDVEGTYNAPQLTCGCGYFTVLQIEMGHVFIINLGHSIRWDAGSYSNDGDHINWQPLPDQEILHIQRTDDSILVSLPSLSTTVVFSSVTEDVINDQRHQLADFFTKSGLPDSAERILADDLTTEPISNYLPAVSMLFGLIPKWVYPESIEEDTLSNEEFQEWGCFYGFDEAWSNDSSKSNESSCITPGD